MGTARQVELLRGEVGKILQDGLKELRSVNEALRAEVLGALTNGLDAHREELQRALGREQRELAQAHKDIRDLRRQLDEARASVAPDTAAVLTGGAASARHTSSVLWPPTTGHEGSELQEETSPGRVSGGAANDVTVLPDELPAAPVPDQGAAPALPVKETAVPDPDRDPKHESGQDSGKGGESDGHDQDEHPGEEPASPGPQEQQLAAQVAAEFAAAARDLDTGNQPSPDGAAPAAQSPHEESIAAARAGRPGDDVLFDTLYKAASISAADIVCHPHTWQFIADCTATAEHFQLPAATTDKDRDGLITIRISGRSLVAVLNALYTTYRNAGRTDLEGRALTLGYYTQIAHEIGKTRPVFSKYEDAEPDPVNRPRTRIVLDRRPNYALDNSPGV
jgi:hypothetical protein